MTVSLKEQEQILMVAEGLIKEERNWIKGAWRRMTRRKDTNGQRVCSFCIHGAVNQACVQVLGLERAAEIGAAAPSKHTLGFDVTGAAGGVHVTGLDEDSRKLYNMPAMAYNDWHESTHEGVLKILHTGLGRVRKRMRKEKA